MVSFIVQNPQPTIYSDRTKTSPAPTSPPRSLTVTSRTDCIADKVAVVPHPLEVERVVMTLRLWARGRDSVLTRLMGLILGSDFGMRGCTVLEAFAFVWHLWFWGME